MTDRNLTDHQKAVEEAAGMSLDWGMANAFAVSQQAQAPGLMEFRVALERCVVAFAGAYAEMNGDSTALLELTSAVHEARLLIAKVRGAS